MIWALLACAAEALQFDVSVAPTEPGIYRLRGNDLTALRPNTTLGTASALGEPPARYPLVLPATPPTLAAGDVLLLVGAGTDAWRLDALAPTDRVPGSGGNPSGEVGPWFVLAEPSVPVVPQVAPGATPAHAVHTLQAASLPAGRYILSAADSQRALLFEATRP